MIDEGDNSALPLTSARVLLPGYRLRFFRDRAASLRLAYGRTDLEPPRYDLALLAPRLLGAEAADVEAAAEPALGPTATVALVSPRLFWTVLSIAVLVLVGLIVRLVKRDDQPGQPAP